MNWTMSDENLLNDIKAHINTIHANYDSRILNHQGNTELLEQKIERLEAELKEAKK